jgi:hypothetical protein
VHVELVYVNGCNVFTYDYHVKRAWELDFCVWFLKWFSHSFMVSHVTTRSEQGFLNWFKWLTHPPHMSHFYLALEIVRSFSFARGHMDLVTVVLTVGGQKFVNHSTVWTIFRLCAVLGLSTCFGACYGFKHTEVRFGEPEPAILKEEDGRRPIFLIFWPIEVS